MSNLALSDLIQASTTRMNSGDMAGMLGILQCSIAKSDTLDVPFHAVDNCIGVAYLNLPVKDTKKSIEFHEKALGASPETPYYWSNLAMAFMTDYRPEEAIRICKNGHKLHPDNLDILIKLANSLHMAGRYWEAYEYQIKTMQLMPEDPHTKLGVGSTEMLLSGMKYKRLFDIGFKNYAARKEMDGFLGVKDYFHNDPYVGEAYNGGINIHLEQGLGDTVMMIPYLEWLLSKDITINIVDHPQFENNKKILKLLNYGAVRLTFGPYNKKYNSINIMDLVGTTMPSNLNHSDPFVNSIVPEIMAIDKIGICWFGNKQFPNYHWRTVHFDTIKPYIQEHGHRLYNLQAGITPDERDFMVKHGVTVNENINDYHRLLAVVRGLKKVITTDTFMSHFAGVIGTPCDTLLNTFVDWRWGYEGEKTNFYPNHRLLRQKKCGEWNGVLDEAFK